MLKQSKYNIVTEYEGYSLLYNTKTGSFASVSDVSHEAIMNALIDPNGEVEDRIKTGLLEGGFICPAELDEFEEIKAFSLQRLNNKSELHLTLFPTEACNFRCPYCFIYNKRGISMKSEVYNSILQLIKKQATSDHLVHISWFGGEPTLEKVNIIKFCHAVNKLVEENNLRPVIYDMVTNGYLMSSENFQEYYNVGIRHFQITLDGYDEDHDTTRCLRDGTGTFKVIWENMKSLKELKGDFEVYVRHNFLNDRYENSLKLLSEFVKEFNDDERFSLYFRPVYSFSQKENEVSQITDKICSRQDGLSMQRDLDSRYLQASKFKRGVASFNQTLPYPTPSWCESDKKGYLVFGADGKVFKCDSYIDDGDKHVGVLMENGIIKYNERIDIWKHEDFFDNEKNSRCFKCKMLPICQGGCTRSRIEVKYGCFWNEPDLRKIMIEHHVRDLELNSEQNSNCYGEG